MAREGSTHRSRRPSRDDLLADIIAYGSKAKTAVSNLTADELEADDMRFDAVLRRLQNVSEATTQLLALEPDFKEKYPEPNQRHC